MKLKKRSKRSNHPIVFLLQTKSSFQNLHKTIQRNYHLVRHHLKYSRKLLKKLAGLKLKSSKVLDLNQKTICLSVLFLNKKTMMKSRNLTQKSKNHFLQNQKTLPKLNQLHRKRKINKSAMKTKNRPNRLSLMELRS